MATATVSLTTPSSLTSTRNVTSFVVVTPLHRSGTRDSILDLEIMAEDEEAPIRIGITAIEPHKPYIVRVASVGHVLNDGDIKML